ncbi:hypothetical protein BH09GEM1_BH09GEM1_04480 [soil metagenome]
MPNTTRLAPDDQVVISIENLSKQYRLGQIGTGTLSHDLNRWWHRLRGNEDPYLKIGDNNDLSGRQSNYVWGLKDVSLDVRRGDVIGIIGKNGAGKSTLLKILSRVTTPTTGHIKVKGRIASLLEVGTGFHPDLTGRENIFLNGAILGMRKHEIAAKLDEIIDFSGCERYIDTPVKRYSSGMYVRLAFAVAAHLEPDILIVDEVLAVGDASFQRKCLGKMGDVAKEGRTILFVSHAMAAVQSLCTRGVLLDGGRMVLDGTVEDVIKSYTRGNSAGVATHDLSQSGARRGTGEMRIVKFWMEESGGERTSILLNGRPCSFVFRCRTRDPEACLNGVAATVGVRSILGPRVFYHHNLLTGPEFDDVSGTVEFRVDFPKLPLSEGTYIADLHLSRDRGHSVMDAVEGDVAFDVVDGDFYGTGFEYKGGLNAAVLVDAAWSCRPMTDEEPARDK